MYGNTRRTRSQTRSQMEANLGIMLCFIIGRQHHNRTFQYKIETYVNEHDAKSPVKRNLVQIKNWQNMMLHEPVTAVHLHLNSVFSFTLFNSLLLRGSTLFPSAIHIRARYDHFVAKPMTHLNRDERWRLSLWQQMAVLKT